MTNDLWPLPDAWRWAEFSEVARIEQDIQDPKSYPQAVHIAPNHIAPGRGRLLTTGTIAGDRVAGPKNRFERGHLLYSKIRPYLAKAVIAPTDGFCSSDIYPIRTNLVTEYLLQWMVSPAFTERASLVQGRTVLPKLNESTLKKLPVPVAPPEEQRRIAVTLSDLQHRTQAVRTTLDAVARRLDALQQSILAAGFSGALTPEWRSRTQDEPAARLLERIRQERRQQWELAEVAKMNANGKRPKNESWRAKYKAPQPPDTTGLMTLPQGWCWASLDELTFLVGGITKGQKRNGTETLRTVPYLRVANVQRGRLDLQEVKKIEATESEIEELSLLPGDILLNEGGDRDKLGRGWIWSGELPECIHQNHVFRARPVSRDLQPRYISTYINHLGQKFFIDQGKQTTNLASVSMSRVRRFPIALPSAPEQAALVSLISAGLGDVSEVERLCRTVAENLSALERSILTKAFRGDLPTRHTGEPGLSVAPLLLMSAGASTDEMYLTRAGKCEQAGDSDPVEAGA